MLVSESAAAILTQNFAINTFLIDNATKIVAGIGIVRNGGRLTQIAFNVTALAGTPGACTVALQGLTGGGRDPSGANFGASTPGTGGGAPSVGWNTISLATPATVVPGDRVGAVVTVPGAVPATHTVTFQVGASSVVVPQSANHAEHNGVSWAQVNRLQQVVGLLADGTPAFDFVGAWEAQNWTSANSPVWRGMKFMAPLPMIITGWSWMARLASNWDFQSGIWLDSKATSEFTGTYVIAEQAQTGGATGLLQVFLPTPVKVAAGQTFRVMFKPTTVNVPSNISVLTYPSTMVASRYFGGLLSVGNSIRATKSGFGYTSGDTPGTWTDDATKMFSMQYDYLISHAPRYKR